MKKKTSKSMAKGKMKGKHNHGKAMVCEFC